MFFNSKTVVPAVAALAALNGLASAAWTGTIGDGDTLTQAPKCPGLQPLVIGGNPSDDEIMKLCKAANENPCDDIMQSLSDNGPGNIQYTALDDVDCKLAGPAKGDLDQCKDQFVNCFAKTGGVGGPNQSIICRVRNGDDEQVASIGVLGRCLPTPGGKRSQEWTA